MMGMAFFSHSIAHLFMHKPVFLTVFFFFRLGWFSRLLLVKKYIVFNPRRKKTHIHTTNKAMQFEIKIYGPDFFAWLMHFVTMVYFYCPLICDKRKKTNLSIQLYRNRWALKLIVKLKCVSSTEDACPVYT